MDYRLKDPVLRIDGVPLQIMPTYKYLGITVDSTLLFNYHVKSVASTVSYKISLLAIIRKYLTDKVALKIYKSMVLLYFDYGDVIYSTSCQEWLEKLQRLQNRGLKICTGFNVRFNTKGIHSITNMPQLKARKEAHINNFMYCRLNNRSLVDDRNIRTRAHDAPLFRVSIPKNETY